MEFSLFFPSNPSMKCSYQHLRADFFSLLMFCFFFFFCLRFFSMAGSQFLPIMKRAGISEALLFCSP